MKKKNGQVVSIEILKSHKLPIQECLVIWGRNL